MDGFPNTSATRMLDLTQAEYTKHQYAYHRSGAVTAAKQMRVSEHAMIKTLVMETNHGDPFIILMHGEKRTDLQELAQHLGVRNVSIISVVEAQRLTGYMVGGISPFGTSVRLDVYVEETILELDYLYLNGGRRGFILGMTPETLVKVLDPIPVCVAK